MADAAERRYRIIILGAGFSRPAGLPLGRDLFSAIRGRANAVLGPDNYLESDLQDYIDYRRLADGATVTADDVDFELMLSYLDIEHYLGLKGKDTWSRAGNRGQEIVKRLIGQIIHTSTPRASQIPDVYLRFVDRLDISDIVLSFNYDVLLERALECVGKPYRLFPNRYSAVYPGSAKVDDSRQELVLLKLHGSVDWFDKTEYDEGVAYVKAVTGTDHVPPDPVFGSPAKYGTVPIAEGPRPDDDHMRAMYRILNPDAFYETDYPPETPFIISPSYSKFVYSRVLHDCWWGLGRVGGWNLGLSIIGLSLSPHDEYLRRVVYNVVRNYQESWWDEEFWGVKKTKVKLIDFRQTESETAAFMARYRFIDLAKTVVCLRGFNDNALDLIFRDDH